MAASALFVRNIVHLYFFFNDTATTESYTLSLHDALPIFRRARAQRRGFRPRPARPCPSGGRSAEHTSALQSRQYLVCRLLLEQKTKQQNHSSLTIKKITTTEQYAFEIQI